MQHAKCETKSLNTVKSVYLLYLTFFSKPVAFKIIK